VWWCVVRRPAMIKGQIPFLCVPSKAFLFLPFERNTLFRQKIAQKHYKKAKTVSQYKGVSGAIRRHQVPCQDAWIFTPAHHFATVCSLVTLTRRRPFDLWT
jgi:hypothetical protein